MSNLGITTEKLLETNQSLVICSPKLFGLEGPLNGCKGHDQNASAAVGVLHALGEYAAKMNGDGIKSDSKIEPEWPEPGLVNDFTTGLFGALGIMTSLLFRAMKGGAWQSGPSLAATCTWYLHKLPLIPENVFKKAIESEDEIYQIGPPTTVEGPTPKGYYRRAGHVVQLDKTPLYWPSPLINVQGSSPPCFQSNDRASRHSKM